MAFNFVDYFTPAAFAAYWENAYSNQLPYFGSAFFNTRKKMGLDLKWIKGAKGLTIPLMNSTFDAKAKFRDHVGFSEEQTEMPFFREGYLIKEKDRQELMRIQDSRDPYAAEILARTYDDVADLIEAARIIPEQMIWSLMAPANGNVGISIVNNGVDYTYNYDPDGAWKAENYTEITTASDKWSASETADPIGDIQEVQNKALNRNGTMLGTAIMSNTTFNYLLKAASIKSAVLAQNVTANVFITGQTVRNIMSALLGLNIVVYLKQYKDRNGTTKPFYPDNYVTFVPSGNLGTVCYGTTPEEADLMGSGKAEVSIVDTGVAISRILHEHPVNIETLASEIVLPSFERMDDVYVMKVV